MIKTVIKRNGQKEPFSAEKLSHWADWASVVGADWAEVVRDVFSHSEEEISTKDLQKALIKVCEDKLTPAYDKMAGRLFIGGIYKDCFGTIDNIPDLNTFYKEMVSMGYWEDMGYSPEELDVIDNLMDHESDLDYTYSQLQQIVGKYAIQDRVSNIIFETPQFTYMRMALGLSKNEKDLDTKLEDVSAWYNYFSDNVINSPTPNYMNLGTRSRSYASCCLFSIGDNAKSQAIGDYIADTMTCASAGIGAHYKTRSPNDPVKGGIISHQGKIPYIKSMRAAVGKQTQGGRGGSATVHFNVGDPEVEDLIKLRNITTVPQKRVDAIDYSLGDCSEFRRRVALGLDWPLFSYYNEPELYEAMYSGDTTQFDVLLKEYEDNPTKNKTYVKAADIVSLSLKQMPETGRFYSHYITEINRHTPFKESIYLSNLC